MTGWPSLSLSLEGMAALPHSVGLAESSGNEDLSFLGRAVTHRLVGEHL